MKVDVVFSGNYPVNDLQQFATGLVSVDQQAMRVIAEICSIYPERNEAIINAGLIALAREAGVVPGFARLTDAAAWNVGRLSQEHGILVCSDDTDSQKVEDFFHIGQKLMLHIQHACITAAPYGWYFIVDENDTVQDIWYPWRGW
jgi:D-serine deaminase-like pyridoxal phosphate-dependent protein